MKLKLKYFGHLMQRIDSLEKTPAAGKDWRTTEDEIVGWHHWLNGHEFEQAPGVVMDRESWHAAVHGVAKSWTQLSDWTELNVNHLACVIDSIWDLINGEVTKFYFQK